MRKPSAQQIAKLIRANCQAESAGQIDWAEFSRRQRAAWDLVVGRPRTHDRVLEILYRTPS